MCKQIRKIFLCLEAISMVGGKNCMREGIVAPALLVENNQFVKEHQKCRKRAFNDFDCSTCLMALYTQDHP